LRHHDTIARRVLGQKGRTLRAGFHGLLTLELPLLCHLPLAKRPDRRSQTVFGDLAFRTLESGPHPRQQGIEIQLKTLGLH
jgi:hypothetical protein